MRKSIIQFAIVSAVTYLMMGCGAPSVLLVDGVKVEKPSQSRDPEIITLPYPVPAAIDSIKLDLIQRGFTIKESDHQLGIIQTDEKILARGEDFSYEYSGEQIAAGVGGCIIAGIIVGGIVAVVAASAHDNDSNKTYNNSNNCHAPKKHYRNDHNDHDDHDDHYVYVQDTKPDIIQTKGRLQIIAAQGIDSLHTTLEISAYLSSYRNGIMESETQTIRLHPFVQKYACLLAHKSCGRAPGQKIIQEKPKVQNKRL